MNSSRLSKLSSDSKIGNNGQMIIGGTSNYSSNINSAGLFGNQMSSYGNPINTINSSMSTHQHLNNTSNNSNYLSYNLNTHQQNQNMSLLNTQMQAQMPINQYMNMVPGYPYMAPNPNPNIYNPIMMNYNYINQPYSQAQPIIGYNPYHMANNAPLNNFNRNILQPSNQISNKNQPVKITDPYLYSNPSSLPTIHESSQANINQSNISKREQDKARIQRSMSSRQRLNDSKIENSLIGNKNNNSKLNNLNNVSNDQGPNTNPDSFSKRIRNSSYSNRSNYNEDGTYKPYTLKDYKEISQAKIVMGSLGPNTGTKEWEERQLKLKKMEEYATAIKQNHKSALRVKKETPQEVLERQKREKIEASSRNKSSEYAKLIKPRSRMAYDSSGLDNEMREDSHASQGLMSIKTDIHVSNKKMNDIPVHVYNDNKSKFMQDYQNRNSNSGNNLRIYDNHTRSDSNIVRYGNENESSPYSYQNENNSGESELIRLQKLREVYNPKINEIKESLFK